MLCTERERAPGNFLELLQALNFHQKIRKVGIKTAFLNIDTVKISFYEKSLRRLIQIFKNWFVRKGGNRHSIPLWISPCYPHIGVGQQPKGRCVTFCILCKADDYVSHLSGFVSHKD